jgi:hypothetical protein
MTLFLIVLLLVVTAVVATSRHNPINDGQQLATAMTHSA